MLVDLLDMSESNFSTSGGIIKPLYSRVDSFTSHVKTAGFDGIIVDYGTSDEIVVFDPLKIKSATDNIGTFDKTNTSTRRALPKKGNSSSMEGTVSPWRIFQHRSRLQDIADVLLSSGICPSS